MKTVFLFIHHHSHIADLLNTDYIKYLSEKYKVVVFLPKREGKASLKENDYYKNKNITYIEQPLEEVRWWYRFKLLRGSCIRQFDFLLSTKINYKRTIEQDWRKRFLRKVSLFVPKFIFSTRFFTWLEGKLIPDADFFVRIGLNSCL